MAIVYRLTSPSGKVYIGWSSKTLDDRLRIHAQDRARQLRLHKPLNRFYSAWFKYPIDQWQREVLVEGLSNADAQNVERLQIESHQSLNVDFGYNIAEGGSGGNTGRNGELAKRLAHSQKMLALNQDAEFRRSRINKAQQTVAANPDRFAAMAEKRKRLLLRGKNHQNHTGIWVVNHNQYGSLREAVQAEPISESTIMKWCNRPDIPHKCSNSRTGAILGQTPRQQGFYRIKEDKNGKV